MVTKRDQKILVWIEKYKSITINQCAKIFFTGNKEAYDQARKRLQSLYKEGLIKRYRKDPSSEVVYFMNRKLKVHDLKVFDVVAEFISSGFELIEFEREVHIKANFESYILDAKATFGKNNKQFTLILEVDYTHFTSNQKIDDMIVEMKKLPYTYVFIIVKLIQEKRFVETISNNIMYISIPWDVKDHFGFENE